MKSFPDCRKKLRSRHIACAFHWPNKHVFVIWCETLHYPSHRYCKADPIIAFISIVQMKRDPRFPFTFHGAIVFPSTSVKSISSFVQFNMDYYYIWYCVCFAFGPNHPNKNLRVKRISTNCNGFTQKWHYNQKLSPKYSFYFPSSFSFQKPRFSQRKLGKWGYLKYYYLLFSKLTYCGSCYCSLMKLCFPFPVLTTYCIHQLTVPPIPLFSPTDLFLYKLSRLNHSSFSSLLASRFLSYKAQYHKHMALIPCDFTILRIIDFSYAALFVPPYPSSLRCFMVCSRQHSLWLCTLAITLPPFPLRHRTSTFFCGIPHLRDLLSRFTACLPEHYHS